MDFSLSHRLEIFMMSLAIAMIALYYARSRGFFYLGNSDWTGQISSRDLLGAFLFFLGMHLIAAPALAIYGSKVLWGGQTTGVREQGWMMVLSLYLSCLALFFYTVKLTDSMTLSGIHCSFHSHQWRAFYSGILSLFIGYPIVVAIGQCARILQSAVFGIPEIDQVAVKALKLSFDYPVMAVFMILGVVCIVPIAEELLFRGYLQGWMRHYLRPRSAIIFTSIIFASFHYSFLQGWSNVELLLSLFALSILLGFLYEKKRTLWAPIGLHIAFNLINVIFLIYA